MQVADRLASSFITENLQDRTVQADQTSQFLQTQLEDARRRLADHEQKLEQFRKPIRASFQRRCSPTCR